MFPKSWTGDWTCWLPRKHTSKSALLLQGAELVLQRHRRRRDIGEGLDFLMSHDAELLTRIEDA